MSRIFLLLSGFLFLSQIVIADENDPNKITYITKKGSWYSATTQQKLVESPSWQQFVSKNANWTAHFNESNQLPHRAYGEPIFLTGKSAVEKATNFLTTYSNIFEIPVKSLVQTSNHSSDKYEFVMFKQQYKNLDIINSNVIFKFNSDGKLALFGLDVFSDINISVEPEITTEQSIQIAKSAFLTSFKGTTTPKLKVVAIPSTNAYSYVLAWETTVLTSTDLGKTPGEYYTLVDAQTGKIIYRDNMVRNFDDPKKDAVGAKLTGTIYPKNNFNPTAVVGLPHLKVTSGANTYYSDINGNIEFPAAIPSADFRLSGKFSTVYSFIGTTPIQFANIPTFVMAVPDTLSVINYDNKGATSNPNTIRHLSAYYHVNVVHDSMKTWIKNFTSLDIPLATVVDRTDGNCNAYYTTVPNSINFYTTNSGCSALSQVADVIYHEYGHAITNQFYIAQGTSFQNGAMGEGYSDIFAIAITRDPILGAGFSSTNPATSIRRYDINPKIYPQNLVGQVHADGEIICGAWWRTASILNNVPYMMQLLGESIHALPNAPNGGEGELYTDILIDALMADDNDGNLANGTPNGNVIVNAFAFHGITLLNTVSFFHIPVYTASANQPIVINSSIILSQPWSTFLSDAKLYYKTNVNANWDSTSFVTTLGNNYTASIPAKPAGTVVAYFVALKDVFGYLSNVQPEGAHLSVDPNLPNYIIVGASRLWNNDFDALQQAGWQVGLPGDNATTGKWIIDEPMASYDAKNNTVQTGSDFTLNGTICAVTANASSPSAPFGEADVDNGWTRIQSPVMNMSQMTNPIISYQRWFTNNQGSNPSTDAWYSWISNDGNTWIPVEQTLYADHTWRQKVIRVKDYVNPTSTVSMRFMAVDSVGNGGAIVEAALDDIELWDASSTQVQSQSDIISKLQIYPNPARDNVNIAYTLNYASSVSIKIYDMSGRLIQSFPMVNHPSGQQTLSLPIQNIADGLYQITVETYKGTTTKPLVIKR